MTDTQDMNDAPSTEIEQKGVDETVSVDKPEVIKGYELTGDDAIHALEDWRVHIAKITPKQLATYAVIARMAHSAVSIYNTAVDLPKLLPWAEASLETRISAIYGVYHVLSGEPTPAESHASWMKQKLADGWVYGAVKDEDLKTHPCIMPYEELPYEQQAKDLLFIRIVRAAADALRA